MKENILTLKRLETDDTLQKLSWMQAAEMI